MIRVAEANVCQDILPFSTKILLFALYDDNANTDVGWHLESWW